MRSNMQNDKLEQWVMHRAVNDEVLGSILGCNKQKVFFDLKLYLLYRLSIPICFNINQFTIKREIPFNKAKTDKTVKNSKLMTTDKFNKNLVIKQPFC